MFIFHPGVLQVTLKRQFFEIYMTQKANKKDNFDILKSFFIDVFMV